MQHLSREQYDSLSKEINDLKKLHQKDIGENDYKFITTLKKMWELDMQTGFDIIGTSKNPIEFIKGVLIHYRARRVRFLETHNILHNQYISLKIPGLNPKEFDFNAPVDVVAWCKEHNGAHHTKTNVVESDPDLAHGWLRTVPEIKWHPLHLFQIPVYIFVVLPTILYRFSSQQIGLIDYHRETLFKTQNGYAKTNPPKKYEVDELRNLQRIIESDIKKFRKEYFTDPINESGYNKLKMYLGLWLSDLLVNIHVGLTVLPTHNAEQKYPKGYKPSCRGEFYLRQIESSSNYCMAGVNSIIKYGGLNYQIEHHLFPSIPSWRYHMMSKDVQRICEKYKIKYKSEPTRRKLFRKYLKELLKFSLPDTLRNCLWRDK